jgi:folate-binding protein YgfZ
MLRPMPNIDTEFQSQYAALTSGAGVVDFTSRTQLELTGADRASFLHNLCTNSVRELAPGSGCEAFVVNVKGHIVGHVFIFAGPNSHVVETVPGQAEKLLAHFDRYRIREDVALHDRSHEWAEVLLAGPRAASMLGQLGLPVPSGRLAHVAAQLNNDPVWLRRIELTGPGDFLVACAHDNVAGVRASLISAGAAACREEAFQAARIENGTPLYGADISEENLPQEISRDQLAISFTKGCYLGQETVARIDALGHVNRILRGVRFPDAAIPAPGAALLADSPNKIVGNVTSSCWSPRLKSPLALAFLKRGHHEVGTKLNWQGGAAEVVELAV